MILRFLDPLAFPVGWIEDSHGPRRRLAPCGLLAILIPYPDFPKILSGCGKLLTGVLHLDTLIRDNFAAAPEVALILGQRIER